MIYNITGLKRDRAVQLFHLDQVDIDKSVKYVLGLLTKKKKNYDFRKFIIAGRYKHWRKRNISPKFVRKFDLGFDTYTQRLVIPLFQGKRCIGLSRRATRKDQEPKYLNTKDMSKHDFLFGYNTLNMKDKYVLITEGVFDAINLRQFGFNSIALMGLDLTATNAERIVGDFDKVCFMLDNDKAGRKAQNKMVSEFLKTGIGVYSIGYEGKDPGEITEESQLHDYTVHRLL